MSQKTGDLSEKVPSTLCSSGVGNNGANAPRSTDCQAPATTFASAALQRLLKTLGVVSVLLTILASFLSSSRLIDEWVLPSKGMGIFRTLQFIKDLGTVAISLSVSLVLLAFTARLIVRSEKLLLMTSTMWSVGFFTTVGAAWLTIGSGPPPLDIPDLVHRCWSVAAGLSTDQKLALLAIASGMSAAFIHLWDFRRRIRVEEQKYQAAKVQRSLTFSLPRNPVICSCLEHLENIYPSRNWAHRTIPWEDLERSIAGKELHYTKIVEFLAHFETMALEVRLDVADESTAFDILSGTVIDHSIRLADFIKYRRMHEKNDRLYVNLLPLAKKWKQRRAN